MSNDVKKTFERVEIQAALEPVVKAKFEEMGIPQDPDHARRKIRTLARLAAQVAIEFGCPPPFFMALCGEAYAKEAGLDKAETPEEAQAILEAKLNAKGEAN